AFTPDCRRALAAGADFTLHLWDIEKGEEIVSLPGHTARVLGITISSDGKQALSCSQDYPGLVLLWDLEGYRLLHTLRGHFSWARCADFLPDDPCALTGGNDARLLFWNLGAGVAVKEFKSHTGPVGCITMSRFGRLGASSGWDKTIRVWDVLDAV